MRAGWRSGRKEYVLKHSEFRAEREALTGGCGMKALREGVKGGAGERGDAAEKDKRQTASGYMMQEKGERASMAQKREVSCLTEQKGTQLSGNAASEKTRVPDSYL